MELEQRTTLEELGMDPENEGIISDLLRFVSDKEELYKEAGKDWKRGYLLYNSPGTDRSSLIATMANFLEFDICHLDLMGLTSISELMNVLVSIRNRSLIAIKDFDRWFANELTLSGLLKIIHGLLSSCGDEQIILLTTNPNHIDRVDVALLRPLNIDLYIHTCSPLLKALPDGGEIILLDSSEDSEQKPLVDFYATNKAYQSDVLVPNSEDKNTQVASRRQCMPEPVRSLVDSTARISWADFDATDNRAHLVRAYQSGPVLFNSEERDTGEGLTIYDPGSHRTDSLALISYEALLIREQPIDCVPLLSLGRLALEDCVQLEKLPDLPRVTQINRVEQRVTKLPRYLGGSPAETGMEGELVGQNEVANVFQRDFMGGPITLNTESGLIMVSRPPDQHGERNTSIACRALSRNVETGMEVEPVGQNQEANVSRRDFMYGPITLTDGLTFPECSDAVAPSQPMATILDTIPLNGGSSECAFQVKNQSTQFTANPYPNCLVDPQIPHPQIALTQILSENMERLEDRTNLLAPQKEPLPDGHVFGSVNWTVRSCSDVALSQPMTTIPHTTGCSEYWRNSLALLEEHLLEENDYGSINLTAPSSFDPGPSQPMHTIPHTMPTIPQTMPLLTKRQDMRSVRLKATYGNTTIKFPLPSGFSELKEEVSKRLEFERGSFKLEYKDEEGDSVLIACDDDVRDYLRLLTSLGNQVIKLFVLDKDIFLPGFPLLNQNSSNSAAFSRASHCFGLGFVSYRLKLVPNLISVMVSMVSE
ncbi:hypothetical protein RHGRI_038722 [Rhododendron griersonianum]|uniref:PB1 domain-containing protein n=1 Tax=Rhododendron griersonianum TaxID=479676 RepID=A0AAV6HJC1_9ERIC|nr:hypothetical protein RHGRI_038722 [Rhododendron griersonianum]